MKGWKTWTGVAIVGAMLEALSKVDPDLTVCNQVAGLLYAIGGGLGLIGLGHKIEKR